MQKVVFLFSTQCVCEAEFNLGEIFKTIKAAGTGFIWFSWIFSDISLHWIILTSCQRI